MADIITYINAEGFRGGSRKENPWARIYAAQQNRTVIQDIVIGIEEHELNGEKIRCWVLDLGDGIKGLIPRMETGVTGRLMSRYLGETVAFMVLHADRENKLVLCSRAKALERMRESTLRKAKEGEILDAVVKRVTASRIWLDVGGFEVMMNRYEAADVYADLRELFEEGENVKVEVINADPENQKLEVKILEHDPWSLVGTKYHIGGIYTGRVARLLDVGYFVDLEPGVTVFTRFPRFWRDKLPAEGDRVKVRVEQINQKAKRLVGRIVR